MRRVVLLTLLLAGLIAAPVVHAFTTGDQVKVHVNGKVVGELADGRNVVQTDGGVLLLPDSALEAIATPSPEPTATPTASPEPTATETATPTVTAMPSPSPTETPTATPTAAPTGTATPAPTTEPSRSDRCFASPGACGFPDPTAGNVGVPGGTDLTASGSITVNTAGTVIDGRDVKGDITVNADNVTIRNTRITAAGSGCGLTNTCGNSVIRLTGPYTVTVSHAELTSPVGSTVEHAIRNSYGGKILVDHVYQHGDIDALCWCGNAELRDNYSIIHLAIRNDHLENTYSDGHTLVIDHNTFLNEVGQTANIFANTGGGSGGACRNRLTINRNLLAGGGFSIYACGNATSDGTSSISITNNRIARCGAGAEVAGGGGTWVCKGGADANGYFPRGGDYGTCISVPAAATVTGNKWDDTSASADSRCG